MKHIIELLLLGCLALQLPAAAQEVTENATARFGVTLGIALCQNRDEVLNNVRHSGPSITAGVFLQGGSSSSMYHLGLAFGFAPLKDRYSPDRSSILFHPTIEFRYAWKALQVADRSALFLGGTVGWSTRFSFYENWDQGHAYWLTSSHVGLGATLVHSLANGKALQLDLDAPVLALVSRPPKRFEYKEVNPSLSWMFGEIHKDTRLTSIREHRDVKVTIGYGSTSGGVLHRKIFWQTAFVSTRLPQSRPFTSLSHKLGFVYPF